eukprot:m.243525 g.243525  ORF g.243525 m.243525 type:complete len:725 (+) comp19452_c0_seq4:242-2416(+)
MTLAGVVSVGARTLLTHQYRVVCTQHTFRRSVSSGQFKQAFDAPHRRKRLHKGSDAQRKHTGIFQFENYRTSGDISASATVAIEESYDLVRAIHRQPDGSPRILELFDDLSNTLCRAADPANCLRQVHPDEHYYNSALGVCRTLGTFIESLNTDKHLFEKLNSVVQDKSFELLDETSQRVAQTLLLDFERSGVSFSECQSEIVALQQDICELEYQFESGQANVGAALKTRSDAGVSTVMVNPSNVYRYIRDVDDHNLRTTLYNAAHHAPEAHKEVLDQLLSQRFQLATMVGYESFGHKELSSNMLNSPSQVDHFLHALFKRMQPKLNEEIATLQSVAASLNEDVTLITMCDRHRYIYKYRQEQQQHAQHTVHDAEHRIESYLSVGNLFEGLHLICKETFGVELRLVEPNESEVWRDDVQKIEVVHETEGVFGVIYCDLFHHNNKGAGAAHYTIQTGKAQRREDGSFDHYQHPIVVLSCCFPRPSRHQPALLTFSQAETLYHEMGHALHSMFARPKYQSVAGTRCSHDFVELPSTTMEFFLRDYRVISRFAKHVDTQETLPRDLFSEVLRRDMEFMGLNMVENLIQAATDQQYHGANPLARSTTETLQYVRALFDPLHRSTATLQYRFGHLCGYAAAYYSYLWCQALSSMVWQQCFQADPLNRAAGDRYRQLVLAHGNASDPWKLMEKLFGQKPTIDAVADSIVSRWDLSSISTASSDKAVETRV